MILNYAQELGSLNSGFVIIWVCHFLSDLSTDMTNFALNKAALGGPRRYCLSTAKAYFTKLPYVPECVHGGFYSLRELEGLFTPLT